MTQKILRLLSLLLGLAGVMQAHAWGFREPNEDGIEIYYNILSSEEKTVAVCADIYEEDDTFYIQSNLYDNVTEITIPASVTHDEIIYAVTEIDMGAFCGCLSLTSVKLPETIKVIGRSAFGGTSITTLNLQSLNRLGEILDHAFCECRELTSVSLPSSLKKIDEEAFARCKKLKSINIPYSVTEIGGGAFSGTTVNIQLNNNRFRILDGALYNAEMDKLISYFGKGGELIVPDGVKLIENDALSYNDNITSIIIPNSVEFVGAIRYNANLKYLQFPDAIRNSYIESCESNHALKEVILPKNIKSINSCCFICPSLEKVILPDGLEEIGFYAFGNTNLHSIRIPSTVRNISPYSFDAPLEVVYSDITDIENVTYDSVNPYYETIFGSRLSPDAFLVVPEGTVEAYKKIPNWSNFSVITDDTHYFTMDKDVILSTKKPTPVTVSMTNTKDIIGFQADIVLPEGLTIPRDDEGELKIALSSRAAKTHTLTAEMKGNVVKMVAISLQNSSFAENEGPLFTFEVEATDDNQTEGTIEIKNIILSERGNAEHYLPPVWETYTVRNYTPGDTNDDGRITVSDITGMVDYVVGREVEQFTTSAADMNGDGKVTVGDITMLIDLILSTGEHNMSRRRARSVESADDTPTQPTEYFSFAPLTGEAGETVMLKVDLTNSTPFIAFQADIKLPAGVSIEEDEYGDPDIRLSSRAADHFVSARKTGDDSYRMVVISLKNRQFKGNEGELFSCPLKLDCPAGEYAIELSNLIISLPGNTEIECPDYTGRLSVSVITSVTDIEPETIGDGKEVYYNLQGVRVEKPTAGVYIRVIDGRSSKIIVK